VEWPLGRREGSVLVRQADGGADGTLVDAVQEDPDDIEGHPAVRILAIASTGKFHHVVHAGQGRRRL